MATTTATQIQQLYVGLLGRAADQGGLNWWADQVTTGGKTLEDVRASFVTSTEYTTTYGAAATRADLVTSIYQNLFERTPSADEVKYWAETDTRPADQLVAAFIEFAGAADQAVINNKTFVAQTYTDTVGDTDFNKDAAKQIIADVDGTPASVSAALQGLENGTLPGSVPGVNLINNIAATAAAYEAQEKAVFAAHAALDTSGDKLVSAGEAQAAYNVAVGVRALAENGGAKATIVLDAELTQANTELATAREAVVATAPGATAITNYEKAVADRAALKVNVQADVDGATASVNTELNLDANVSVLNAVKTIDQSLTTGDALYDALSGVTNFTVTQRADIADAIKGLPHASSFSSLAANDLAITTADHQLDSAEATTPAGIVNNQTGGAIYLAEVEKQQTAADLVTAAKAADVTVAEQKSIFDSLDVLSKASIAAAGSDVTAFETAHPTVDLQAIGAANLPASDAKSDVFYFAAKPTTADINIADFGKGTGVGANDYIVLGSNYTFNSGALTTGDNNKAEFFLVQKGNDALVIVESEVYGSASVNTHSTAGDNAAVESTNAAVITLTGVNVADLSVNNGVISHHAAAVA